MRRLPRLRSPAPAGLCPSSTPAAPLRVPGAAIAPASSSTLSQTARQPNGHSHAVSRAWQPQTPRYLSTSARARAAAQNNAQAPEEQQQQQQPPQQQLAYDAYETAAAGAAPEIKTDLVYPRGITTAPSPDAVTDATYKPAETAEGLAEVGGLAGWWDDPAHWGGPEGPARAVRACAPAFGPRERVTDPAVLEVLARRAVVEALVVARFGRPRSARAVDRVLGSAADAADRLHRIVRAQVVAGEDGAATLGDFRDWQRVWDILRHTAKTARKQQQQQQQQGNGEKVEAEAEAARDAEATEATEAAEAAEGASEEAASKTIAGITPEEAQQLVQSWDKGWRKAELRDPIIKFILAKRIQQLTGHRIPDGKMFAIRTIDGLLKQLVEPPKPKKLAELVQSEGVFKGLPNVRVFPRRVTPIDKEQMVGRWKIIVRELEKRNLPITGTGDYGEPVEKKWIEGRA